MKNFIVGRIKSFKPAIQGLAFTIRHEKNTRIHLIATIATIIFSYALQISVTEWLFILNAIFFVWFAELINTVIEKTIDMISREKNNHAKIIKDISAGFVLLTAIYAVICGLIIFLPKLLLLF